MEVQDFLEHSIHHKSKGKAIEHWREKCKSFKNKLSIPSPSIKHKNIKVGSTGILEKTIHPISKGKTLDN